MSRRLDDLDLVAFLVDGVHFGEHCCVVALGIGIDGTQHPLSLAEGSTENKTLVTGLITDPPDRVAPALHGHLRQCCRGGGEDCYDGAAAFRGHARGDAAGDRA